MPVLSDTENKIVNYNYSNIDKLHDNILKYIISDHIVSADTSQLNIIQRMLQNKDDPKMAAPEIAIAIMSLFYSVILKGVCMHRASKIEQFIK